MILERLFGYEEDYMVCPHCGSASTDVRINSASGHGEAECHGCGKGFYFHKRDFFKTSAGPVAEDVSVGVKTDTAPDVYPYKSARVTPLPGERGACLLRWECPRCGISMCCRYPSSSVAHHSLILMRCHPDSGTCSLCDPARVALAHQQAREAGGGDV